MNKLIKGARYSSRAAREQRLRLNPPQDWGKAADALRRADPNGKKLQELLRDIENDRSSEHPRQ